VAGRAHPTVRRTAAVAIALGGAAGAGLRWAVLDASGSTAGFAWPVFVLNVAGSLVLGAAMARAHGRPGVFWRDGVGIGFCGGLTTFSTFAVEAADLIRDGRPGMAATYVGASVVAAIAAVVVGAALAGGRAAIDAIDDPLESAP
jgi:CrcB protein